MMWKRIHDRRALSFVLAAGLIVAAPGGGAPVDEETQAAVVRLLSPPGRVLAGRSEIEVLLIDPEVYRLVFYVDGAAVDRRDHPPWIAKLKLASPPREQTIEVVALGRKDRELGRDRIVVNRRPIPFRVRITSIGGDPSQGALEVAAEVSVPRGAELERVELYWNEELRATFAETPVTARLTTSGGAGAGDFVRAVATLRDGRSVEDVEVLGAPGLGEEIEVNLVQLQVVVTRKNGAPVVDLGRDDFEILQGREPQEVASFRVAGDVPLVLGLVVDSSGSMEPVWNQTLATAKSFLHATLGARDRAFLVDFDLQLRLLRPLTHELGELTAALDAIRPEGGTALYDSMAFSLLQFDAQPGRRALVVLTDGIDSGSTTSDRTIVEVARKLGVPVYVVALPVADRQAQLGAMPVVHALKLVADPTGGRLLRLGPAGVDRAFAQINAELRHQYVLGYYTDELPDEKGQKITVRVKGRKNVEVRAVFAWDQLS
ncbi:MAG: VWA domain-containing protein [bacterium]|nr:VWA domain-containing protein [bacterium]